MRCAIIAGAAILLSTVLTGCAGSMATEDPDAVAARTLAALAPIAVRAADVPGDVQRESETGVRCWRPGEHLVASGGGQKTYRVICRVPFAEAGQNRYRDVICVGELGGPAPDHCVRWAHYSGEPGFEDAPAVRAS